MKNSRIVITVLSCVALVVTFTLLVSYAYWRVTKIQTGTNTINGACLNIELDQYYDEDDNLIEGFTLENAWPITDEEGENGQGYSFKILNTCESAVVYQVILDSLDVSGGRMNTSYVKVKLDNHSAKTYASLENAGGANYLTIDNKILYTGVISESSEVSHTLKLWISYDAPNNEIGKEFSSKIRVEAGQNLSQLRLMANNEEQVATVNNISVGDRVKYGTEEFYVIGINGNNVKLLSRYLINVGPHAKPGNTQGLQDAEIGFTRTDVNDASSGTAYFTEYYPNGSTSLYYYGAVAFSDSAYWWERSDGYCDASSEDTFVEPYNFGSFIYNEQSNLKRYVDNYVNTLKSFGLNVTSGSVLSIQEAAGLCNSAWPDWYEDFYPINDCPNYLNETIYWLGSVADCTVYYMFGGIGHGWHGDDYEVGIRPVINIVLN